MTQIPYDPVILLSYVNTQLRDHFSSLKDLCDSLDLEEDTIQSRLLAIDYHYDPELNQFR